MKKFLILSIFALSILSLSACGKAETTPQTINDIPTDNAATIETKSNDCPAICETALPKCVSLTENDCLYKCQNATNIEKACLKNFQTCEELARNCRQPETTNTEKSGENNCPSACNNYVLKCISQVPNATETLEKDAYNSCMVECAKWDNEKINCMSISPSCEGFTNQCGL